MIYLPWSDRTRTTLVYCFLPKGVVGEGLLKSTSVANHGGYLMLLRDPVCFHVLFYFCYSYLLPF
jgi:hypothetical protein